MLYGAARDVAGGEAPRVTRRYLKATPLHKHPDPASGETSSPRGNSRGGVVCQTLRLITGLLLEHGVLIADGDKLLVAEALGVRNVREVGIPLLAELADNKRLVQLGAGEQRCGMMTADDSNVRCSP